ncbi:MAG: hypothetical protein QM762_14470 [Chryseolinea sp.]
MLVEIIPKQIEHMASIGRLFRPENEALHNLPGGYTTSDRSICD